MGGSSGGGGGGQAANKEAERLAGIQGDISLDLFNQTGDIREAAITQAFADLSDPSALSGPAITAGAIDPISLNSLVANPQFGALKDAVETSFGTSRDQLIGDLPGGGVLGGGLAELTRGRASELVRGLGSLAGQEQGRLERERLFDVGLQESNRNAATNAAFGVRRNALAAASGGAATGQAGLGSAGGTLAALGANQAALAESQANRDAGKSQGIGRGIGAIAGAAVGGPAGASAGASAGGMFGGS